MSCPLGPNSADESERTMACLTPEQIDRFARGDVSAVEEAEFQAEVARCDACRLQYTEAAANEQFAARLRAAPQLEAGQTVSSVRGLDARRAETALSDGEREPAPDEHRQDVYPGYEIIEELSHGGQGVVYKARQKSTKREVALKVLLDGPRASLAARRRFEREIELVAQLNHKNIIAIFHAGVSEGGQQFYVMDYVRGRPLGLYIRQQKLSLHDTLRLFVDVCDAVQFAHQRGIIHRDLKPSNVLVDPEGQPKVLDFGLAKQVANLDELHVTLSNQVVGTLPYMSPEQTRGGPESMDTRTDVYALGVMLYEALTGHYPYPVRGAMMDVLRHIAETPPTPPTRNWSRETGVSHLRSRSSAGKVVAPSRARNCPIDADVQTIVLTALAKEPERRYQSAGALADDLRHYLGGEPIDAKRDSASYVLYKLARQHAGMTATVASLALLTFAFAIVSTFLYGRTATALAAERQWRVDLQSTNVHLARVTQGHLAEVGPLTLGWFLEHWHNGRLDRAAEIRDQVREGAPARQIMDYLLDPGRSLDDLLADLPAQWHAYAHFAAAERHRQAGKLAAARSDYECSLAYDPTEWLAAEVRARLAELEVDHPG